MVWVNPEYVHVMDYLEENRARGENVAECTNCQGVGRHIIVDKKTKKTHSITCINCQGTGQK